MAKARPCARLLADVLARRCSDVGGLRERDHPLPSPRLNPPAEAEHLARAAEGARPSAAPDAEKRTLAQMGQKAHLTGYARLR